MKTALVALTAAAGVSAGMLTDSQHQYLFTSFVATHNKQYETKDFFTKFNTFKNNLEAIVAHNANPKATHTLGVNQFADMTTEEFNKMNGFRGILGDLHKAQADAQPAPKSGAGYIDWREKKVNGINVVGPVTDQGACGSCWAFSTAGTAEAAFILAGGKDQKLSEQELVDCSGAYGNHGCNGGLMSSAFNYYLAKGAVSGKDYTYNARDGTCKASNYSKLYEKSNFVKTTSVQASDAALQAALQDGPVAIALAASSQAFQFYKSGVITDRSCNSGVNHALVLVAFTKEKANDGSTVDAYTIRNSWGSSWGNKGYVAVGTGNICGMTQHSWNQAFTVKP